MSDATLAAAAGRRQEATVLRSIPSGFQAAPAYDHETSFDVGDEHWVVRYRRRRDGRRDAACYTNINTRPVARLAFQSGGSSFVCTGWLVAGSNSSTLITNNHCFSTQTETSTLQALFNYQRTGCATGGTATTASYAGGTFLKTNSVNKRGKKGGLDYTLCTLQGNPEGTWGELVATTRSAAVGNQIYFIQHPGGGLKEVVAQISGRNAYRFLRYESGGHRVQRVPETESGGRIHTSTATVAVLPEAEDVEVDLREEDLHIDVYRSSGPGGQSVNTTDSAVRITHRPTGIVVACQEERSQRQNREKAMRYLRARLLEMAQDEQAREEAAARKAQVGTGERSEKIRTYNFPQSRVTDHRIKVTSHDLEGVLAGSIDGFVDALMAEERARQLRNAGGS